MSAEEKTAEALISDPFDTHADEMLIRCLPEVRLMMIRGARLRRASSGSNSAIQTDGHLLDL